MHVRGGLICVVIMAVCALSARYGREKRRAGGRVTPRDVLRVMAIAWAAGWAAIGLPALLDTGRYAPWSDTVPAGLALLTVALAPLAVILAAAELSRLVRGAVPGDKKPTTPHPLD